MRRRRERPAVPHAEPTAAVHAPPDGASMPDVAVASVIARGATHHAAAEAEAERGAPGIGFGD